MADHGEQRTEHLPDGSTVRFQVRTAEPTAASIFAADLSRRLRKARRPLTRADVDRSLAAYASYAPGPGGDCRSTQTHDLPTGEVTVDIDATGRSVHGYLRYLVRGAVAYAEVLDIEPGRAGTISLLCVGAGALLFAVGQPFLAVPFVGAAGIIGAYVGLYWLSALGHPLSLSRTPLPVGRFH